MPPDDSEFTEPQGLRISRYYHTCDPNVRPYARVNPYSWDRQTVTCHRCGYAETWNLDPTSQRWVIA